MVGIVLATKSILKNVNIKDRKLGKNFVDTLETAYDKKNTKELKLKYKTIKKEEVKDLFRGL